MGPCFFGRQLARCDFNVGYSLGAMHVPVYLPPTAGFLSFVRRTRQDLNDCRLETRLHGYGIRNILWYYITSGRRAFISLI